MMNDIYLNGESKICQQQLSATDKNSNIKTSDVFLIDQKKENKIESNSTSTKQIFKLSTNSLESGRVITNDLTNFYINIESNKSMEGSIDTNEEELPRESNNTTTCDLKEASNDDSFSQVVTFLSQVLDEIDTTYTGAYKTLTRLFYSNTDQTDRFLTIFT